MRSEKLRHVIEELGWHCEHPAQVAKLLTDSETDDIVKKGFVTKELWKSLEPRIAASEVE